MPTANGAARTTAGDGRRHPDHRRDHLSVVRPKRGRRRMSTDPVDLSPLTEAQARRLTEQIREHAEQTWVLLKEAHDRSAWSALGYTGFGDYCEAEFQMSRGNAWRLINQGRVVHELAEAAKLAPEALPPITARTANALAPVADRVARKVAKATAGLRPARRAEVASEIIAAESRVARARREAPEAPALPVPAAAVPDVLAHLLGSNPGALARQCADPHKAARDVKRWAQQFEAIAVNLASPDERRTSRDRQPVSPRFKHTVEAAPARDRRRR